MNACGVRDSLSGDMLTLSQLVIFGSGPKLCLLTFSKTKLDNLKTIFGGLLLCQEQTFAFLTLKFLE